VAHDFVICDVFTDRPLTGNQLAVFPEGATVPDELLQSLAREINYSETTFVYPPSDAAAAEARVRIFTPATELPFAGHPVLGTAVVVGDRLGLDEVRLETGAGVVPLTLDRADDLRSGRMVQPVPTVEDVPDDERRALLAALGGVAPVVPVARYAIGIRHMYVVVESVDEVLALQPDLGAVARVAGAAGTSVVAGSGRSWTSRMFAPGAGVAEDPATGSAAGPLAVHLCRAGLVPWGTEIDIDQGAVLKRPSRLRAVAFGSDERIERVEVAGDVVVVGNGSFTL
jgi:trans-2,3-dihydro-3-hydroxyanthranilate isomerase